MILFEKQNQHQLEHNNDCTKKRKFLGKLKMHKNKIDIGKSR